MAGLISLGRVKRSENGVKGGTPTGEYNLHCTIVLEFRHPRVVGASSIVFPEVLPTVDLDEYSVV